MDGREGRGYIEDKKYRYGRDGRYVRDDREGWDDNGIQ